jgi:hypothetical protein
MHVGLKVTLCSIVVMVFSYWLTEAMVHKEPPEKVRLIKSQLWFSLLQWMGSIGFFGIPVGLIIWIVWR